MPETIRYVLYDTASITGTSGGTDGVFFHETEGAASAGQNTTNMENAGQLPDTHSFIIQNICINFDSDESEADVEESTKDNILTFRIDGKTYLKAPIYLFPIPRLDLGAHGATTVTMMFNGTPFDMAGPDGTYPVLPGATPFDVRITSYDTTAVRYVVMLMGWLTRPTSGEVRGGV